MTRANTKAVLFKGPEDGLEILVTTSEPCPQAGYHLTDDHDRMGRTVYEWRPETQKEVTP